jgi:hypothetical protein
LSTQKLTQKSGWSGPIILSLPKRPDMPRPTVHQGSPKSRWTAIEDEWLRNAVLTMGTTSWKALAQQIPGRTGKQCRERWVNHLRPVILRDKWTPADDRVLIVQQGMSGNHWAQIAQALPGRSTTAIKNRWMWLCKRAARETLAKRHASPPPMVMERGPESKVVPKEHPVLELPRFPHASQELCEPGELSPGCGVFFALEACDF